MITVLSCCLEDDGLVGSGCMVGSRLALGEPAGEAELSRSTSMSTQSPARTHRDLASEIWQFSRRAALLALPLIFSTVSLRGHLHLL